MWKDRRCALQALLNDPDPGVKQAAATALDAVEAVADLDQLLDRLKRGARDERIAAAYALERINVAKVYPALLAALQSRDPDLRLVAVQVLGAKKHPKTLGALARMLDDPEPGIQAEAARVLSGFADRRLPGYLAPLVNRDEQVALAAIETLGVLAFPEGEEPLLKALVDERTQVRRLAAEMLGRLSF
ncbi:MAG: HEAT repeat domain-containing protein [Desulfuromonadales bacterium]|nr:HEAT repeat domain-containing protein [Desulfuromonadales bacterium]